jgi:hypothetical protein
MFSWSNNQAATTRTQAATYPAVRGSIRPPPEYTRQQHLDSFVDDETLKRSTRKVSAGKDKIAAVFTEHDVQDDYSIFGH